MLKYFDLTISIVSFNTKDKLKNCLDSIYQNTRGIRFEVIVVDNGSKDGSAKMVTTLFPEVNLIKNSQNLFFTRAHNMALRKARGKFVLILNSDTTIPEKALKKMVDFLKKNPSIGALGVRLQDSLGNIEITAQRFTNPVVEIFKSNILSKIFSNQNLLSKIHYKNWDRRSSRYVDAVSDACLLSPRFVLEQVSFYDERFLLFFTEDDLCRRIKQAGYKIYFLADVFIIHLVAQSLRYFSASKNYQFFEHDMLEYYKKYFGRFWWITLWAIYRPTEFYWKLKPFINRN